MRGRILKLLDDGALTIPEIAEGLGRPPLRGDLLGHGHAQVRLRA